jgi:hypothetical protein
VRSYEIIPPVSDGRDFLFLNTEVYDVAHLIPAFTVKGVKLPAGIILLIKQGE